MAFLLNRIFLSFTWILVSCNSQFSRCLWDLKNNMASVLAILYITAFVLPHCNTVLTIFSRIRAMSLIKNPKTINPRSSTNEKAITKGQNSEIESKTLLMYIIKKIGKARDLYRIPVSISFFLFLCPSIIIWIFRLIRKDFVYATKFLLISSSIIRLKSWCFETWSKTPLTSINKALASFFSSHDFDTLYTKTNITSIADLFFQAPICPRYNLEYASQ